MRTLNQIINQPMIKIGDEHDDCLLVLNINVGTLTNIAFLLVKKPFKYVYDFAEIGGRARSHRRVEQN